MNPKSLRTLEFDKILTRLADHASFSAGRELALALQPSTDFEEVVRRQGETTEAKDLLDRRGGVSLGGAHDVRPQVKRAAMDAALMPQELLDIRDTLVSGRTLRRMITRGVEVTSGHARVNLVPPLPKSRVTACQGWPLLAETARQIEECPNLVAEIGRCINDQGEVVDEASPALARIRRDLRITHERLMTKLERLIASPKARSYLQEPLITQREGRYVIPIKAEFKGRLPGLVHDTSASGATLFIEPLAVVEMGNRWRELQLEEQKEIERILRELSAQVAAQGEAIIRTIEALAKLDLAFAKARYSQAIRGWPPELLRTSEPGASKDGPYLKLVRARHPLLPPDTVVPIDVHSGDEFRILILTGPNTGGKTVSLKTVGLLTLMAQAGLHLPTAEGSILSVFSGIYADIGDEQSIEQSLSTFSSHMTNIIDILEQADERSLVLLDELGAGTDPTEGSALARAILAHLLGRNITTLVATHYPELKIYAHVTPGVENACVEFDLETLSPTYELTIGLPGRSNALAIATRLGLSPALIEGAEEWLTSSDLELESLLAEIKTAREEAVTAREAAQMAQREAEGAERELKKRLVSLEAERREVLNQARRQAQEELTEVRKELGRIQAEMRRVAAVKEALAQTAERVEELAEEVKPLAPPPKPPPAGIEELAVGDAVWVAGLGREGQVLALLGDEAEVQIGSFRAKVPLGELELKERKLRRVEWEPEVTVTTARPLEVGLELNLRGLRVEEAMPRLDKYLDDAYLAGLPKVRIVHGKGTGTLRRLVREALGKHPLIASFRPGDRYEGGDGVTIAELVSR
jgi:DNA mismatch repair protein MutS2